MTTIVRCTSSLLLALLAGCATIVVRQTSKTTLEFLQDGSTSKETVLRQFGDPFMVLMEQRLLIYRMVKTTEGYAVLERFPDKPVVIGSIARLFGGIEGLFHLMLLFDAHGILQQHALVQRRPSDQTAESGLEFLQDGTTTKTAALLQFGAPSGVFIGETVLAYWLRKISKGYFWEQLPYEPTPEGPDVWILGESAQVLHLMLEFDVRGLLQHHALVLMNDSSRSQSELTFLVDGVTTKAAVLLHFGSPTNVVERETILTYRLGKTSGGYFVREKQLNLAVSEGPVEWLLKRLEDECDLVLVFDAHNVLWKHSLIQLR